MRIDCCCAVVSYYFKSKLDHSPIHVPCSLFANRYLFAIIIFCHIFRLDFTNTIRTHAIKMFTLIKCHSA